MGINLGCARDVFENKIHADTKIGINFFFICSNISEEII